MEAAHAHLGSAETAGLVLVADDEEDIRSLVALRLRRAGYDVVTAADGEEALRLARQTKPDLLILDVSMPVMDGLTVCCELQGQGAAAPPVIFLTARTHSAAALEGGTRRTRPRRHHRPAHGSPQPPRARGAGVRGRCARSEARPRPRVPRCRPRFPQADQRRARPRRRRHRSQDGRGAAPPPHEGFRSRSPLRR